MNEDLHNINSLFNAAYKQFEDDPSAGLWEKINSGLDKKEAQSYKRRSLIWKRVAILSLLLLTGFILYESVILKTGISYSNDNTITKETNTLATPVEKNETLNQNKISPQPGKNNEPGSVIKDEGVADLNTVNAASKKNSPGKKIIEQKPGSLNKKVNLVSESDQILIAIATPGPNKKTNGLLKDDGEDLPKRKTNPILLREESMVAKTFAAISRVINENQLPVVDNFPLIHSNTKGADLKKNGPFKSYWAITGCISTDRANYRLDNDLPTIVKIEQREQHEPSFSAGILLTRQIKNQWGLQAGLVYSNTAIGISPQKMYALQDQNGNVLYKYITSSGYAYIKPGFGPPLLPGDSLVTASAKHTLQHLIVPLVIKYTISTNNKLSVISGVGIAGNFLTSAKIETEIEDASNRENVFINKLYGERSFYWSVGADAEVKYNLSKKTSVILRPSFRYAISSITKNNDVATFPYSFGLGAGATYKF